MLIGQWPEAAMVMFLFALAAVIEAKSLDRVLGAYSSTDVLAGVAPGALMGRLSPVATKVLINVKDRTHQHTGSEAMHRAMSWLLLAAIGVVLDQVTKWLIASWLMLGSAVEVTSFFNVVHVLNRGAAFSFLANESGWQRWFFSAVAFIAAAVLIVLLRRERPRVEAAGFSLILAGAVSNLIDRLYRGAVVDWLDFYWKHLHWPAFNLADVWITCGAALMILASLRPGKTAAPCSAERAAREV